MTFDFKLHPWALVFLGLALPASLFQAKLIKYSYTVTPTPSATPVPWTVQSKIDDAKVLLSKIPLKVGTVDIAYTEDRVAQNSSGVLTTSKRQLKEVEKEIALAVLDQDTGDLKTIVIDKKGGDLIAPAGWQIDILARPNGIRWNAWNTAWRITQPAGWVVIADVYPNDSTVTVPQKVGRKTVYVKKQNIDYVFYSPYSPDLHSADLVASGRKYIYDTVAQAMADLKAKNVMSRAVSGMAISDVFAGRAQMFAQIPFLENTDPTEFLLDPQHTVERVAVIIGANEDGAFGKTCNGVSACGWVQFTPKTYASIVKAYPSANLISDFKIGAADNLNAMKAALLLYDENLRALVKSNGTSVIYDSKLPEYLAASYNGNPVYVRKTLSAAILSAVADWITALTVKAGGLRTETQIYLLKLRYLQQNNLP